ncbi:MAG: zinc dependent phospholipase C family protein, partial [Bryobacteraceae bacterium]
VSKPALERAFAKTYSLDFPSLFFSEDLAFGTYRHSVASVFPTMTKAAWNLKKDEIRKARPTMTKRKYIYNMSRASYRKQWGNVYERPGFFARILSFLFRLVPKVGPLRAFAFQPTPPAGQTLFMRSFNDSLGRYRRLLQDARRGTLRLPNRNFDTGEAVKPGAYRMADDAYAKLVDRLQGKPVSPELRANVLSFYADLQAPLATKRNRKKWRKLLTELDALKGSGAAHATASSGSR